MRFLVLRLPRRDITSFSRIQCCWVSNYPVICLEINLSLPTALINLHKVNRSSNNLMLIGKSLHLFHSLRLNTVPKLLNTSLLKVSKQMDSKLLMWTLISIRDFLIQIGYELMHIHSYHLNPKILSHTDLHSIFDIFIIIILIICLLLI